jgi:hypothetical protein
LFPDLFFASQEIGFLKFLWAGEDRRSLIWMEGYVSIL